MQVDRNRNNSKVSTEATHARGEVNGRRRGPSRRSSQAPSGKLPGVKSETTNSGFASQASTSIPCVLVTGQSGREEGAGESDKSYPDEAGRLPDFFGQVTVTVPPVSVRSGRCEGCNVGGVG
jgi:hypothetical protein